MSEKKRKRLSEEERSHSKKKVAAESPAQAIKISHIESEEWTPILASAPGIALPKNVSFEPYKKSSEILLHSSQHPRLDYTAREERSNGSESHLKHYIGIYDPERQKLQLIPAKKLVARSTLRSQRAGSGDESSDGEKATGFTARNKLGLAFGTKKSQKAIKNLTVNAINASPAKPKPNADGTQSQAPLDALSEAVLASMAVSTSSMPSREELQASIDQNKPRPKPNLSADSPAEVYPVEELVGGEFILRKLAVKEWFDKINAGGDVPTNVLFVARRLLSVAKSEDVKKMRVLKYMCLLVGWYRFLKPGSRQSLRVPKLEAMPGLVQMFGSEVVLGLAKRFSQDNVLNKWHQHLVLTHILALALTVDDFSSDTHHIRQDLKLEMKEIKSLYKELGCPLRAPTEGERAQLGITKAGGAMHKYAVLKLPLEFPKSRVPARGRR